MARARPANGPAGGLEVGVRAGLPRRRPAALHFWHVRRRDGDDCAGRAGRAGLHVVRWLLGLPRSLDQVAPRARGVAQRGRLWQRPLVLADRDNSGRSIETPSVIELLDGAWNPLKLVCNP